MIGAMLSVFVIWIVVIILLFFAVWRIADQHFILHPVEMVVVATAGVICNLLYVVLSP